MLRMVCSDVVKLFDEVAPHAFILPGARNAFSLCDRKNRQHQHHRRKKNINEFGKKEIDVSK